MSARREKWVIGYIGSKTTLRNLRSGYDVATFNGTTKAASSTAKFLLDCVRVAKIASRMMHWREAKYKARSAFRRFDYDPLNLCAAKGTDCYDRPPGEPRCEVCARKEALFAVLQEAISQYATGVKKLQEVLRESHIERKREFPNTDATDED